MKMVLTRKLADRIDGVDLSGFRVGECLEISDDEAQLLAAEGWAVQERRRHPRPHAARQRGQSANLD